MIGAALRRSAMRYPNYRLNCCRVYPFIPSVKRKTLSRDDVRLFKDIAMEAEAVVIAWEENNAKDLMAFVILGYAMSRIDGNWHGTKEDLIFHLYGSACRLALRKPSSPLNCSPPMR